MYIYKGRLTFYSLGHGQMMNCVLVDMGGWNIDVSVDKEGQIYYDLDAVVPIVDNVILEVHNKDSIIQDGRKLLWKGRLKNQKIRNYNVNVNFVPKDISLNDWIGWFEKELWAVIYSKKRLK